MNVFDKEIIGFLNSLVNHFWMIDRFIVWIEGNDLLKGGVLCALIWWRWFAVGQASDKRSHLLLALLSCLPAVALGRGLALALPYRPRPIHNADLGFILPKGMTSTALDGWSAFPSDHAVLFFTLATGLLYVSRRFGLIAICYTLLIIFFPRVYIGLHNPTDILAGMLIGLIITWACHRAWLVAWVQKHVIPWSEKQPGLFYAGFFLFTFQISALFIGLRQIAFLASVFFKGNI